MTALPVSINLFWKGKEPGCSQQLLTCRSSPLLMRYGDSPSSSSSCFTCLQPSGFLGQSPGPPWAGVAQVQQKPAPGCPRAEGALSPSSPSHHAMSGEAAGVLGSEEVPLCWELSGSTRQHAAFCMNLTLGDGVLGLQGVKFQLSVTLLFFFPAGRQEPPRSRVRQHGK